MRTVSLVDHLEFEYQGNLFSKAITVGDVDNDKGYELVVGNVEGDLHIYKGTACKPWARAYDLGMITCVEIGDVCNHGLNYTIALNAVGWAHVFTIRPDSTPQTPEGEETSDDGRVLKPVHRQQLAPNSKVVLITDIDGDGFCELVVGHTDRRVCAYRWTESADTVRSSSPAPGQPTVTGQFVLIESWHLSGQIGSMTVNRRSDGSQEVLVSQPGGTFVTLLSKKNDGERTADPSLKSEPYVMYHPLGSGRARNPGSPTEVVGSISRRKRGEETNVPHYSAICTFDGTLTLVDDSANDDKILWSVYVDHQLFSLTKLDITGDGTEEVVACSWDGQTYMLNLNKDMVRFQFREHVAAFCAGCYGIERDKNVACLIYATFNNRIVVYYNLQMRQIGSTDLIQRMEAEEETTSLLQALNCDASKPSQLRQLYRWCLYGYHPKSAR